MLIRIARLRSTVAFPQRRTFLTSPTIFNEATKHTSDSYNRDDVDPTPPSDSSVYRVDSLSEMVQKPHEPPSGKWSRTGVEAGVGGKQEPYAEEGQELRYGGKESLAKDKGPETSKPDEGPNKS
ncbi:hypothetical protein C0991_001445 [Blastosporella zonata]|nr:hypothetical protein C0991_001445 [Blastosporella zonata]